MRESQAIIERVRRVASGWQQLFLSVEDPALEKIKPGQTVLARPSSTTLDPYLRQNWIPVAFHADQGTLIIETPLDTLYNPGEVISLIGPIGSPFSLRSNIRNLLLIAQDCPPTRLLFLMEHAIQMGMAVTLVLAGEAQNYPISALPPAIEVLQSPDPLLWPEQQQSFLWAEQVFITAHSFLWEKYYLPILRAAQNSRTALPIGFLQGVFDIPIPCGTGGCMACMLRCNHGEQLVCIDGPAFDLSTVKLE